MDEYTWKTLFAGFIQRIYNKYFTRVREIRVLSGRNPILARLIMIRFRDCKNNTSSGLENAIKHDHAFVIVPSKGKTVYNAL